MCDPLLVDWPWGPMASLLRDKDIQEKLPSRKTNLRKIIDSTAEDETKIDTVKEDIKDVDVKLDENGIQFNLPGKWKENEGKNIDIYRPLPEENIAGQIEISYILDETIARGFAMKKEADKIPKTDEEAIQKAVAELRELYKEFKELCIIVTIDTSKTEGKVQKELFSKYENKDLIGKVDNFEFYLLYNNKADVNGLSENSQKAYEEAYGEIKNFKSLITTYKPVSETEAVSKNIVKFKTKTLEGKEIDSSIFKDSKLTMINVWGTFCTPCIAELSDLQKLSEEVKSQNVNVIGIVSDTPDKDNEELAKEILSKKGVTYTNIIPDETIINNILEKIALVPTTLFVDSEGNVVGDLIVGSKGTEEYKKEIVDRLKNIE